MIAGAKYSFYFRKSIVRQWSQAVDQRADVDANVLSYLCGYTGSILNVQLSKPNLGFFDVTIPSQVDSRLRHQKPIYQPHLSHLTQLR